MTAAKTAAAIGSSCVGFLFGSVDIAFQTLLFLIAVDYLTGIAKAIKTRTFDREAGSWGIVKKIGTLLIVAIAVRVDALAGSGSAIRTIAIYSYIGLEGLSAIQNLSIIGVLVPKRVARYFVDLAESVEDSERGA